MNKYRDIFKAMIKDATFTRKEIMDVGAHMITVILLCTLGSALVTMWAIW